MMLRVQLMDFFRKLQEVTDNVVSLPAGGSPTVGEVADLDAEDLTTVRRRAVAAESLVQKIREEARTLNEEFAAYKTKVKSWREQVNAARHQDRKTIEALRQAGATDVSAGGPQCLLHANVDAAYVSSLEEQVRSLKETIRDISDSRDKMQTDLTSRLNETQAELRELSTRSGSTATTEASAAAAAAYIRRLESDVVAGREAMEVLERKVDALNRDLTESATAHTAAVASYERRLARMADESSAQQYIKTLEAELKAYRKHGPVQEQEAPSTAASLEATPPSMGVRNESAALATCRQVVAEVSNELRVARDEIERLKHRHEEYDVEMELARTEASLREEAIDDAFKECHELRASLTAVQRRCDDTMAETLSLKHDAAERARAFAEQQDRLADANASMESMQKTVTRLHREIAEKNEAHRRAKLDLLKTAVAGAQDSALVPMPSIEAPRAITHASQPASVTQFAGSGARTKAVFAYLWSSPRLRAYTVTGICIVMFVLMRMAENVWSYADEVNASSSGSHSGAAQGPFSNIADAILFCTEIAKKKP